MDRRNCGMNLSACGPRITRPMTIPPKSTPNTLRLLRLAPRIAWTRQRPELFTKIEDHALRHSWHHLARLRKAVGRRHSFPLAPPTVTVSLWSLWRRRRRDAALRRLFERI